jgi:hypothetical protein
VQIVRREVMIEMTPKQQKEYSPFVSTKMGGSNLNPSASDFMKAMDYCYKIITVGIAKEVVRLLPLGGVFVVSKSESHAMEILAELVGYGVDKDDVFCITKGSSLNLTDESVRKGGKDYKIVITTTLKSAGYTLTRLKSMVTGVYPSNEATREQLEGRINRPGQTTEKEIPFVTVHTGILTHIFQYHSDTWALSNIFSQLGGII